MEKDDRGLKNHWFQHVGLLLVVGGGALAQPFFEPSRNGTRPTPTPIEPKSAYVESGYLSPSLVAYKTMVTENDQPLATDIAKPATLETVFREMKRYPTLFDKRDFEDLRMYYEIYREVARKYAVDWRLLWIIHDKETLCSRMKETNETKVYVWGYDATGKPIENHLYGAVQRSKNFYSDAEAQAALAGLEHLTNMPTRVATDAREIAWAGKFLAQLLREEKGNLLSALKRYSAPAPAEQRLRTFNFYAVNIPK